MALRLHTRFWGLRLGAILPPKSIKYSCFSDDCMRCVGIWGLTCNSSPINGCRCQVRALASPNACRGQQPLVTPLTENEDDDAATGQDSDTDARRNRLAEAIMT